MADAQSEIYELKRVGAVPVKNSGRGKFDKGDGIIYSPNGDPLFTVDVKEAGKSFGLSESACLKLNSDAVKNNTYGMFKVVIGNEEPKMRMMVVSEAIFKEMYDAWQEKYYGEE